MKRPYLFIDLGDNISVCSSVFAANLFAAAMQETVYFCAPANFQGKPENFPRVHIMHPQSAELRPLVESARMVIDFTEAGKGMASSVLAAVEAEKMCLTNHQLGADNVLLAKTTFISACTGIPEICKELQVKNVSPVLTYSPEMAAVLNMAGVPTIELCLKSKKPGSFLPGSLVISGNNFTMMQKEELNMVFEFYHLGKIEDIFVNKGVIEEDWDLMYYKLDQSKTMIVSKKYPVSPAESFMDHFFKGFLTGHQQQRTFSIDHLLSLSQKMDAIDLEMTLDFIKKTLKLCIDDIETFDESFEGSYWNLVRPYLDIRRRGNGKVRRSLGQALIGLDLFHKIHERQRKVASMH